MKADDVQLQEDPALGALVLYWLADGHQKARAGGEGLLIPWGMLGMGLVMTDATREGLPKAKSTLGGWLTGTGVRSWRGEVPDGIRAWKDAFWQALAVGTQAGILHLDGHRLKAVRTPRLDKSVSEKADKFRKCSRALGGTIGAEPSDHTLVSALGLEFAP